MNEPMGWAIPVALWRRHHKERPLAPVRCGGKEGSCRAKVGAIWRTDEGYLLHGFGHVPPRKATVRFPGTEAEAREALLRDRPGKWREGEPKALLGPLIDKRGSVAILDSTDYWFQLHIACKDCGPLVVDRANIMAGVRKGPGEVVLVPKGEGAQRPLQSGPSQ